nr:2-(3-amino-3-carboxypropyl)histidine synthase subunit 2-like [Tanacetum cinerariifolium]
MSSITAQQTKLDIDLVPEENKLDIGKCNGRIPQVYMHQFWNFVYKHDTFYRFKLNKKKRFKLTLEVFRDIFQICSRVEGQDFDALPFEEYTEDFIYQIDNKVYKKQEKMYYPRFMKDIIHHFLIQDNTLSWRNKIRMHTSKDDYLNNTLRFVSAKESTQIYGKLLLETLTTPEMKESKAYKTYLGYASGAVPPKIARKFKKASLSKKDSTLVPLDDETIKKGVRGSLGTKGEQWGIFAGKIVGRLLGWGGILGFLKPYHGDEEDPERRVSKRAPTVVVTSYDREVEEILSDRTIRRRGVPSYKEYLIKWRDLPDSEAS